MDRCYSIWFLSPFTFLPTFILGIIELRSSEERRNRRERNTHAANDIGDGDFWVDWILYWKDRAPCGGIGFRPMYLCDAFFRVLLAHHRWT